MTKSGKYEYCQVVHSYKEDGVTRHKVLFGLGRLDKIKNDTSIQSFAKKLLELSGAPTLASLDNISESEIVNWGHIVYKKIWDTFGLDSILSHIASKTKIGYCLSSASFLMTLNHLLSPSSKLAAYNGQNKYMGLKETDLHQIYRSLDVLADAKEEIEAEIFERNKSLFNMEVDVVFYDVTTISFCSERSDDLKDFGFSKDGKPNKVQVVLGLVIDCYGRPVGYELFSGNTFDGKTLPSALDALKRRFGVRKLIIVADKGISSKINLKEIEDAGYSYIFAYRLKQASEAVKVAALSGGYIDLEEQFLKYKVIEHTFKAGPVERKIAQKIIITYSDARARKDKMDRDRAIEKAKELLKSPSKIKASNKRGAKKYIKEEDRRPTYYLNEDAIEADERFDGYYAIATNEDSISPEDAIDAYHSLWKIEDSFKIMKSTLEVRPVFVWTPKRIKGHFVICFLAFLLARHIEYKLAKNNIRASAEKIRQAINSLQFAKIYIESRPYLVKTKANELANKILRILKIASPKNVTAAEEFPL
ncbi:MAG: IS1634 family transposase [Actinobacteria bacterium]|nr:IS1634 family transposase [Actinomycetota bacterium]